jgi:formylglycine-generating enzyme required for sulfatase activity
LRGCLSTALVALQQQPITAAQIPPGMPHAALAASLAPGAVPLPYWLLQDARRGEVLLSQLPPTTGQSALLPTPVSLASADVQPAPHAKRQWLELDGRAQVPLAPRGGAAGLVLRSSDAELHIAPLQRPRGVVAWHRDIAGLHLRGQALGDLALKARPADIDLLPPTYPHEQNLRIAVPPQQQGDTGISFGIHPEHGLFMDMALGAVAQRFIWIEATEPQGFLMGSSDAERARIEDKDYRRWAEREGPQHRVHLTAGFWLADTPCTQAMWLAVQRGKNPSHFHKGADWQDRPVEQVSADDVDKFLKTLQSKLPPGCEAMLPNEAQWEYACRAGTHTAYWWGDEFDGERANVDERYKGTTPVKQFEPNPWGLHDMHGNVWEWCADGMREYHDVAEVGPAGSLDSDARVVRGGSWIFDAVNARAASRSRRPRVHRSRTQGFRLALRSTGPGGAGIGRAGGQPLLRPEGAAPRF